MVHVDSSAGLSSGNVYVSGLPLSVTLKKFRQLFSPFGTIIGARLFPRRKGFSPVGFVQFTDPSMAHDAVATMNGVSIEGYVLSASLAKRDKDKGIVCGPCPKLHIANLPKRFGDEEIHAIFSRFGPLRSVRMLRSQGFRGSTGNALVVFQELDHAVEARAAIHGAQLPGGGPPLEVKFAETSQEAEERKALSTTRRRVPRKPAKGDKEDDSLDHVLPYITDLIDGFRTFVEADLPPPPADGQRPCAWMDGWGCMCPEHVPKWPTAPSPRPPAAPVNAASICALTQYMHDMSAIWQRSSPRSSLSGDSSAPRRPSGGRNGSPQLPPSPLSPAPAASPPLRPKAQSPLNPPSPWSASGKGFPGSEEGLCAYLHRLDAAQLARVSSLLSGPWLQVATCHISSQALNCP